MPFKKVKNNDYVSPSGKHWTKKQVVAYHASNGFKNKRGKTLRRGGKRGS